jgi:choline dehydrogenase-like flavoprotein
MITDIEQLGGDRLQADICIVGGGAAGLTLAAELDGGALRVVVLEAGREGPDPSAQGLYDSAVIGLPHGGIHGYRLRGLGGSTVAWAGQVLPLFDIDFERRDWIPGSGWPLTRDDLEPYYRRLAELMEVPPFDRDAHGWPQRLPPPPPIDRDLLAPYYSEFSPRPNFAQTLAPRLRASAQVTVVLGAVVTELVPDPLSASVDALSARSLSGRALTVVARFVVLCGGGFENARLLLDSTRRSEAGIGNDGDLVGRYFQDHPGLVVGPLHVRDHRLVSALAPRRLGLVKFAPRLRLDERIQRAERRAHVGAGVVFDLSQPQSVRSGKLLLQAIRARHLRPRVAGALGDVARDPLPLVRSAARYFVGRRAALDIGVPPLLAVGGEQRPNRESRIVLRDERDAVGMRQVALDWRICAEDLSDYRRAAEIAAAEFERIGIGNVDLDAVRLPEDPAEAGGLLLDSGHHMGTTRMGASSDDGVVDSHGKVFGVDNLYVASCSVFPTGGIANPTFTMLALCLRLADTLRSSA